MYMDARQLCRERGMSALLHTASAFSWVSRFSFPRARVEPSRERAFVPARECSQTESSDISPSEPVGPPKIGAVVRAKIPCCLCRKGDTGRVKAILSENGSPIVVIQSVRGDEFKVSAREYSCFFDGGRHARQGHRESFRAYLNGGWTSTAAA